MSVSEEQGAAVLKAMAEEGATLRRACKEAGCSKTSFLRWKDESRERTDRYARARDAQIEYWADELIDISDDNSRDVRVLHNGTETVDYEVVARSKLRTDNRKWLLSKLRPEKYGEHTKVELSGAVDVVGLLAARKKRIDAQ